MRVRTKKGDTVTETQIPFDGVERHKDGRAKAPTELDEPEEAAAVYDPDNEGEGSAGGVAN